MRTARFRLRQPLLAPKKPRRAVSTAQTKRPAEETSYKDAEVEKPISHSGAESAPQTPAPLVVVPAGPEAHSETANSSAATDGQHPAGEASYVGEQGGLTTPPLEPPPQPASPPVAALAEVAIRENEYNWPVMPPAEPSSQPTSLEVAPAEVTLDQNERGEFAMPPSEPPSQPTAPPAAALSPRTANRGGATEAPLKAPQPPAPSSDPVSAGPWSSLRAIPNMHESIDWQCALCHYSMKS